MSNQHKYLTRDGYEALERELHELRTTQRSTIAENLHQIVDEGGDLIENTAYLEAKAEQGLLEGRIDYLEGVLTDVEIIDHTKVVFPNDGVHIDNVVTVQEGENEPETYHLVGTAEADPMRGKLSDASPLGRALLGKCAGESVVVPTPDGDLTYHILDVQ